MSKIFIIVSGRTDLNLQHRSLQGLTWFSGFVGQETCNSVTQSCNAKYTASKRGSRITSGRRERPKKLSQLLRRDALVAVMHLVRAVLFLVDPGRIPFHRALCSVGAEEVRESPGLGSFELLAPDGKLLVVADQERNFWLYSTDGRQPTAFPGIKPGEDAIRWGVDRKYLFVAGDGMPVEINRIEVATGPRQFVYKIAPKDLAGVWGVVWPVLIMPNGKSYVYSDYRVLSDLYLASGLR